MRLNADVCDCVAKRYCFVCARWDRDRCECDAVSVSHHWCAVVVAIAIVAECAVLASTEYKMLYQSTELQVHLVRTRTRVCMGDPLQL